MKVAHILSPFSRHLVNASYLFGAKSSLLVFAFVSNVIVSRYLGPSGIGSLSFSVNTIALFIPLAALGLDVLLVKQLAESKDKALVTVKTCFFLKLFAGALVQLLIVTFFLRSNTSPELKLLIIISSFALPLDSLSVFNSYNEAYLNTRTIFKSEVLSGLFSASAKVLSACCSLPIYSFSWVNILTMIVRSAMMYPRKILKFSLASFSNDSFDTKLAVRLLKNSWPLVISSITISIYMKIDQIMVFNISGAAQAGEYAIGTSLSTIYYLIPLSITSAIFPKLVEIKNANGDYYKAFQKLITTLTRIAILASVFVQLFGSYIVGWTYGNNYLDVTPILQIHIWSGILVFFGIARHRWILLEGLQKFEIYLDVTGAITNVLFNLVLIPALGGVGAAIATLMSYFCGSIIASVFIPSLHPPLKTFVKSLCPPFQITNSRNSN